MPLVCIDRNNDEKNMAYKHCATRTTWGETCGANLAPVWRILGSTQAGLLAWRAFAVLLNLSGVYGVGSLVSRAGPMVLRTPTARATKATLCARLGALNSHEHRKAMPSDAATTTQPITRFRLVRGCSPGQTARPVLIMTIPTMTVSASTAPMAMMAVSMLTPQRSRNIQQTSCNSYTKPKNRLKSNYVH